MPTETVTRWKKATGSLPPLALLEVGDSIEGKIISVDVVTKEITKKVKGKKVTEDQERVFYRIELSHSATVHGGKKDEKGKYPVVTFEKGQTISLPGAGALDNTMGKIAFELEGRSGENEEPNFSALHGLSVIIKRLPDDKMKKGTFAGNPVKVYDVDYDAEFSPKS